MSSIDVLNATVAGLRTQLESGNLTSVQIVSDYLAQIEKHNTNGLGVRGIISVAPRKSVISQAESLDAERRSKGPRGPFHGIPIVDNLMTKSSLGMPTTFGTAALSNAMAAENAAPVDLLLNAGMIILGKASLSEMNLAKAILPNTGGWSSAGGQGLSPYVRGGVQEDATFLGHSTPCGSSSGSGISVASGFSPIALDTELDGSLVQPASRAGLYALKPTPGTVDGTNSLTALPYSVVGAMGRTACDVADMTSILTGKDFSHTSASSWESIRVGIVEFDPWAAAPFVVEPVEAYTIQVKAEMREAAQKIRAMGGTVVEDISLSPFVEFCDDMKSRGVDPDTIWSDGFENLFNTLMTKFEVSKIHTLAELVEYHKAHADVCLPPEHPSQAVLERALTRKPDPNRANKVEMVKVEARARIQGALERYGVDVIVSHCDGRMASLAASALYPVSALPLGYADFNGRAWGINAVAGADGEGKLLELMSVWERTFPEARRPPPQLHSPSNHAL
ncbi:putative amidase [Astrocystis sublimbata]|nr:putative amidase [Astrocystis sublimbata]